MAFAILQRILLHQTVVFTMLIYRYPVLILKDAYFRYFLNIWLLAWVVLALYSYNRRTRMNNSHNPVLARILQWKYTSSIHNADSVSDSNMLERGEAQAASLTAHQPISEIMCGSTKIACFHRDRASNEDTASYIQQLTREIKQKRAELLHQLVASNSPLISSSSTPSSQSQSYLHSDLHSHSHSSLSSISNNSEEAITAADQGLIESPHTISNTTAGDHGSTDILISNNSRNRFSPGSFRIRNGGSNVDGFYRQNKTSDSSGENGYNHAATGTHAGPVSISSILSGTNKQLITQCLENPLSGDTYDEDEIWDHRSMDSTYEEEL